jgi:hypothetical protein
MSIINVMESLWLQRTKEALYMLNVCLVIVLFVQ